MFANIPKALSSSTNFLHCKVDLLHHDLLAYTQYATSYYKISTMQSIELTGKSKKCFHYFYLILDSKLLAKECKTATYNREAKELLGEAKENLSKVKTTITTCMTISNVHHLRAYLANICAVIEAQFVCDLSLQDIHTLAMFVMACTFALHLSLASMHAYLKKSNCPHKPLVLWGIQMLDQLSILLTHLLCHTKNVFLLSNDRLAKIATDKICKTFKLLNNYVSTLDKLECDTGTIPSCPLFQADEAEAARTKLNKTSKRPAGTDTSEAGLIMPDSKHQRIGKTNDAAPTTDDLIGTLIYTGADMMPSINEANPALCLCATHQHMG
jgi:hypothetical protein